jgi:hypothetical protein
MWMRFFCDTNEMRIKFPKEVSRVQTLGVKIRALVLQGKTKTDYA